MAARKRDPGAVVAAQFGSGIEVVLLPNQNAVALRVSRYEGAALLRFLAGRKDWSVAEAKALGQFKAKLNYSVGLMKGVDDADSR